MKQDLNFINYIMTMSRALGNINRKIADSQQHEELTEQETALLEALHENFYLPGLVTFDQKNINSDYLKVNKVGI
jgi:hypothetical protein